MDADSDLLRRLRQPGCAFGHNVVAQGCGITRAGHAAVEMDLSEPRGDKGLDKILRMRHRLLGRELLPPVWAEVVTT